MTSSVGALMVSAWAEKASVKIKRIKRNVSMDVIVIIYAV